MKIYKITVEEELAATIEHIAAAEHRAPSELIAVMLRDWAFGMSRRFRKLSEADLAAFRKRNFPRINLTAKTRNTVYERDEGRCRYCQGSILFNETFHIDHVVPVSKGGTNDLHNLALACIRCNLVKHNKSPQLRGDQ